MVYMVDGSCRSVSAVVPTRNEAANVGWVLERMPSQVDEIVLVDGGSTDGTADAARRVRHDIVVVHQTRRGKGNALACGFERATGDWIVMIDADGSMDPVEIVPFLDALAGGADYAKGSRFVPGGGSDDISTLRRAGNAGLSLTANLLFSTRYTDLCYGFNAFTRECLDAFALPPTDPGRPQWGDGFEIETMINVRVAQAGAVVREVASFEYERRFGNSNLNTFRDGFRVLRTIWSERWRPTTTLTRPEPVTTGSIPLVTEGTVELGEDGLYATHSPDQPGLDGPPKPGSA